MFPVLITDINVIPGAMTRRPEETCPKSGIEILRLAQDITPIKLSDVIKDDLEPLLDNQDYDDCVFRPTGYAYNNALQGVISAYSIMGNAFLRPSFIPDGDGGIDIEWEYNGRSVLLCSKALHNQKCFIYYETANRSECGSKDFSLLYLRDRLTWLISA